MAVRAEKEFKFKNLSKEDTETRTTRRSRILLKKSGGLDDVHPSKKSVGIGEFFGNILNDELKMNKTSEYEEIMENQSDPLILAQMLQKDIRKLRNYVESFTTRSEMMLKIFNKICEKMQIGITSCFKDYIGLKEEILNIICMIDQHSKEGAGVLEDSQIIGEDERKALMFDSMPVENEDEEKKKIQVKKLSVLIKEITKKLDESITEIDKNGSKLEKGFDSKFITEKIFKFIIDTVKLKYSDFTTHFYQVHKRITYNQDLTDLVSLSTSLFIDEFKICCLIKLFQNIFDNFIVSVMLKFVKDINEIVSSLGLMLNELVPKVNGLLKEIFEGKRFNELDISFLDLQIQETHLNGLLGFELQKFVKKKIEMGREHLLTEEDLKDFFDIYRIIYSRENSLELKSLNCKLLRKTNEGEKSMIKQPAILVLDLTGGLTLLNDFSGNDFDKTLTVVDYFNREIEEIKKSVKLFRFCRHCTLSIDNKNNLIKIDFSIDEGMISQNLKTVTIAVEIEDIQEGVAFLKLFNSVKKLREANSAKIGA